MQPHRYTTTLLIRLTFTEFKILQPAVASNPVATGAKWLYVLDDRLDRTQPSTTRVRFVSTLLLTYTPIFELFPPGPDFVNEATETDFLAFLPTAIKVEGFKDFIF